MRCLLLLLGPFLAPRGARAFTSLDSALRGVSLHDLAARPEARASLVWSRQPTAAATFPLTYRVDDSFCTLYVAHALPLGTTCEFC